MLITFINQCLKNTRGISTNPFPAKTLMSQGRGQRIFSARSRLPGPFQPLCLAPETPTLARLPHIQALSLPHSPHNRSTDPTTLIICQLQVFCRQTLPQGTSAPSRPAFPRKPKHTESRRKTFSAAPAPASIKRGLCPPSGLTIGEKG